MSGSDFEFVSVPVAVSVSTELLVKSGSLTREHGYLAWQLDRAGRELRQAFDLFITNYKEIPKEGSRLSLSAWVSTVDLHGYRARQTKALDILQMVLARRLSAESESYEFLYYLVAFELVSRMHKIIANGVGNTFNTFFDQYKSEVKKTLKRLSLEEEAKAFQRILKGCIQTAVPKKLLKREKEVAAPIPNSSDMLLGVPAILEWIEDWFEWLVPTSTSSLPSTIESSCERLMGILENKFSYQALLGRWVPMAVEANKKYPVCPALFSDVAIASGAHESETEKEEGFFL